MGLHSPFSSQPRDDCPFFFLWRILHHLMEMKELLKPSVRVLREMKAVVVEMLLFL